MRNVFVGLFVAAERTKSLFVPRRRIADSCFEPCRASLRRLLVENLENRHLLAYSFASFDVPGATETHAAGINDAGRIVGYYVTSGVGHGFLKTGTSYTTLDANSLNARSTYAYGQNNAGDVVGFYAHVDDTTYRQHGFLLERGGAFSDILVPGASDESGNGINNNGQIVGQITLPNLSGGMTSNRGFVKTGSAFEIIHADSIGASRVTFALGINDAADVVGWYVDASETIHGFLKNSAGYSIIEFPGILSGTSPQGINSSGIIVGYYPDSSGSLHGFVKSSSGFETVDYPSATFTTILGINSSGQIVGMYRDIAGQYHSFQANPTVATPTANAGGPYLIAEGSPLSLNASGSYSPYPMTYTWDVNGDGVFGDASGISPTLTWAQLQVLGINDGPRTVPNVRVRVDDGHAQIVDSLVTTLTVNNVAPIVSLVGSPNGVRGQMRMFSFGASDSPADQIAGFTYLVNWGDNSSAQSVFPIANNGSGVPVDHVYAASGTYTVTLTATDKDGLTSLPIIKTITITSSALQDDPLAPGQKMLVIGGSVGNDTIRISVDDDHHDSQDDDAQFVNIRVNEHDEAHHKVRGTYALPVSRVVVYAQAGDDDVKMDDDSTIPAWLYGGDGDDRLKGGAGNDVLLGGAGADLLAGNDGRDLMIGGTGSDRIIGNAGDDILIAGTTNFDASDLALDSIMKEWKRTDSIFATRVNRLKNGGGLNLGYVLTDLTVHDDHAEDMLTGCEGNDWFLFNNDGDGGVKDKVTDLSTFEATHALDIDWLRL